MFFLQWCECAQARPRENFQSIHGAACEESNCSQTRVTHATSGAEGLQQERLAGENLLECRQMLMAAEAEATNQRSGATNVEKRSTCTDDAVILPLASQEGTPQSTNVEASKAAATGEDGLNVNEVVTEEVAATGEDGLDVNEVEL